MTRSAASVLDPCSIAAQAKHRVARRDVAMNLTALIMQIVGGAVAGYAAGHYSKDASLGTIGHAVVGALAGGVGGQILFAIFGLSGVQIVSALLAGGVSGGLATLLAGFLKSKVST
jgi:hypothetical protein